MDPKLYTAMAQAEDSHWWFVARRIIIEKILTKFLNKNNLSKDILEIGCGSGGNLDILSRFGHIHGIELDDAARKNANNRKICLVKKGMLPNDMPTTRTYDSICMFDVLEHIEKEQLALSRVARLLKTDGKLIITVPAFMFLWSEHDVQNEHRRRYNKKQLSSTLKKAGYSISYISYFNTILFPLIACIRILSTRQTDLNIPSPWINTILKKIFSAESRIIPKTTLPFGLSLIVVAKKEQ